MNRSMKMVLSLAILASAGAMLSGCENSKADVQATGVSIGQPDDFGRAVHEDLAAQIADPDPAWKNTPQPAANGERAALAEKAYDTDNVKQPKALNTQSVGGGGGGGGGQ